MDKTGNLALIMQMIDAAEKNIQSAKQLLRETMGGASPRASAAAFTEKASALSVSEGGKVIEGVFDGQNMVGPDNKQYPVPANYASKSKLVEGDVLKLTIGMTARLSTNKLVRLNAEKFWAFWSRTTKGIIR
jgi:hypothetical protein